MIVRAVVELAIVLVVFAGLLGVVAYRTARLFATPEPDKLDRLAGGIAATLGLAANRAARENAAGYGRRASSPIHDGEPDYSDDPAVEQADEADLDWREQAV